MSKKVGIRTKCKGTFLSATVVNTCVFLFEEPCIKPIDRKILECFRSFLSEISGMFPTVLMFPEKFASLGLART